jgi:BRO domain protein
MSANSFSFGNHPITVINDADTLWFIAAEIVKAINLSNPSVSLKSLRPAERKKIILQGRETNIISESGMYTLVLRSQDALKEGTAAFRFRVWVTDEVLPAIRKTGQYRCATTPQIPSEYLTLEHQYRIQSEVAKRVHKDDVRYQTVYQALKAHFRVPKYTYILDKDFEAAVEFIRTCELRVPEKPQEEKAEAAPEQIEHKTYVVREDFLIRLRTFVYCWRYLFRDDLMLVYNFLKASKSPLAPRFAEAVVDFNIVGVEESLAKLGFAVKDLDCYKHWEAKRLTA